LNDRNFNDFFHLNRNFLDNFDNLLHDDLNWLNDFLSNQLFSDYFNLANLCFLVDHLHSLFNNGGYFDDAFYCSYHGYNFLNDAVDGLVDSFNVVDYLKGFAVLNYRDCLLDDSLNDFDLWDLDDSFDNFLLVDWYFNDLLNDFLYRHYSLSNHLNFLWFLLNMVNDSFDFNNPLNFDNSLDNLFDFDHFWNLLGDVNYLLNDCWDFYHLMDDLLDRHNFLDNLCLDDWYLQRNVNNPLNFDDFLDLHNLLDLL